MTIADAAASGLAAVACIADVGWRRVPNVVTFGGAALALLIAAGTGGVSAFGLALAGCFVGLLLFLPLFALGGLGAGDVKLLAALGAWLGPRDVVYVALYGAIAGGVFAVVLAYSRGYLRTAFSNLYALLTFWRVAGLRPMEGLTLDAAPGPRLAYTLPMSAGLAVTLWLNR
jgi:Flp pilus assembly protein, protease CpaA